MIKIFISEKQKEEMEMAYWKWMSRYHLKDFLKIIEGDMTLKELVVKDDGTVEISLKKYLLSNYRELGRIKSTIDRNGKKLQQSSVDYIKARYLNYRNSQAAKIVNVLGITACPYCNQNYINAGYDRRGKIKFWGDLDHFYDKKSYPEMALCLYNLIPVCKVCNHLKSSQQRMIVNPYDYSAESGIKFGTEFDESFDLDYLQGKSQNFNIIIDESELSNEDREEIELFDLKNRYKQLKRNAQEIIVKSKAYDQIYEKSLKEGFDLSADELRAYVFGYAENHLDRTLSKFNMDIMNEFRNSEE